MSSNDGSIGAPVSISARSIALGAIVGVVAYLFGYLLSGVIAASQASQSLAETVPAWKTVGWYFYNGHFVDLTNTVRLGSVRGTGAGSLIEGSDSSTLQLLYVVPPIVVALGGAALSRWLDGGVDVTSGAVRGSLVVVGYLPLAAIGAVVTAHTVEASVVFVDVSGSIEPQLVPAIVLAGVLYPIAFGAVGGAIGSQL
jgi:hypothetical protein